MICLKTLTIADSRGKRSKTLFFVSIPWLVLVVKFLVGGLWGMPVIEAEDFGLAVAAVLVPWVGREWKEKALQSDQQENLP